MKLLKLHEKLNRPLLLDGALGSMLEMAGYAKTDEVWSARALVEHPETVEQIHGDYISSGADIITTNTFRTNPVALKNFGYSSQKLVDVAVKIARKAISKSDVLLAGSNPPAEDCYQAERTITERELIENHERHIDYLLDSGADIIWNETMSHLDEIEIICKMCDELKTEYVVSLYITPELELLSGERYSEALDLVLNYEPVAVGFNCIPVNTFGRIMKFGKPDFDFGFYLNCGASSVSDSRFEQIISETEYTNLVANYISFNPLFIGSCCGSNPNYTKKLSELLVE